MLDKVNRDGLDQRWHQEYGNLAVKLLRTCTAQAEALAKLRRREQRVVVEHVHVYPGGKAFVGTVEGEGSSGGVIEIAGRAHAPRNANQLPVIEHASSTALRCEDEVRRAMPVAGGQGEVPMPDARRSKRQWRPARAS